MKSNRLVNPYIAGNPVGSTTAFVGHADIKREVLRVLENPNQNALVLYGQRRIGKTSILQNLESQLPEVGEYHPIYFDLQDKAKLPLGEVLQDLTQRIAFHFGLSNPDLGESPKTVFQEDFLPSILEELPSGNCLILLFDEFDVLADPEAEQAAESFFPYFRSLMQQAPSRLQFVFVMGRNVEDLSSIALSVFKGVPSKRVSLLSYEDTEDLILLSEENDSLVWPVESINHVWTLTNGHPFLTQQLCSRVWERVYEANPDDRPSATPKDVNAVLDETLDQWETEMGRHFLVMDMHQKTYHLIFNPQESVWRLGSGSQSPAIAV